MALKVAALQTAVIDSPQRNLEKAIDMIMRASRGEPDVICLPEAWIHNNPLRVAGRLMQSSEQVITVLRRQAEELGAMIVAGALYINRGSQPRVSTPVIGPDGALIGWQDKIHLFRSEKEVFTRGDRLEVFALRGYRIGVLICHDIVYPELARILALRGVDLVINPSRIPSLGIAPWHTYIEARCLENRIAVAAPNIWMTPAYRGGTSIASLSRIRSDIFHVWRSTAREGPTILVQELQLSSLREARRERLSNRLPNLYYELTKEQLHGAGEISDRMSGDVVG